MPHDANTNTATQDTTTLPSTSGLDLPESLSKLRKMPRAKPFISFPSRTKHFGILVFVSTSRKHLKKNPCLQQTVQQMTNAYRAPLGETQIFLHASLLPSVEESSLARVLHHRF